MCLSVLLTLKVLLVTHLNISVNEVTPTKPFQHILIGSDRSLLIGSDRSLYLTKTTHPPPPTTLHNSVKIRYSESYILQVISAGVRFHRVSGKELTPALNTIQQTNKNHLFNFHREV